MGIAFRRFGGSTHVRIDSFAQLVEAAGIPETQYIALSAPVTTLLVDPAFLAALDTDENGRVRVEELRAARLGAAAATASPPPAAGRGTPTALIQRGAPVAPAAAKPAPKPTPKPAQAAP